MGGVLVTGASGFIGLPMVLELARRGEDVHALSTRRSPPEAAGVRWHRLDLLEGGPALDELMRELRPTRLVHLAWYGEHGGWGAPENVVWVECGLRLMRAFVRHGGCRLLAIGTCAEYDWSAADRQLGENRSRVAPTTLYGVSKDALRRVAHAYAACEGIEFAWGRPFFMYGPRENPPRLVASVVRSLLEGRHVATSSGEQLRDFMHVEDVAGALVALLDSPVVGDVNIGSGVGVTVGEVVDRIVQLVGRPELIRRGSLPMQPGEPRRLVADIARLRDEVGYRPRIALADGLAATVRWWEAQGG